MALMPEMTVVTSISVKTTVANQYPQGAVWTWAILIITVPMAKDWRNILILPETVAAKLTPRDSAMCLKTVTKTSLAIKMPATDQ